MKHFKEKLLQWYGIHRRELPWRESRDAYRIWLSEVILQQTRVAQGEGYFLRFIDRFPTVSALAEADSDEVMKYWQGLGYYSRARNLHRAAKEIAERFGGVFPRNHNDILQLKGIGPYTAAAISSIAYNDPYAVVDGNVYRVLSRIFAEATPIDSTEGKKIFGKLADSLLDRQNPGDYNQAIMDFGAMQCTPRLPECGTCPLCESCAAHRSGTQELFPVKAKKAVVVPRYFNYIVVRHDKTTLLKKRTENDIWNNLYEFPMIETDAAVDFAELIQTPAYQELTKGAGTITLTRRTQMKKHQLSHQTLHAVFYETTWSSLPHKEGYLAVAEQSIGDYPVPRLIERYLEEIDK